MFAIVINKEGYKIDFVILDYNKNPQNYNLKYGEQIIEERWEIANAMIKPKWDDSKWVETGIPEPALTYIPTELDILKEKNATLEKVLLEMADVQSKEYKNRVMLENAVLDLANTIAGGL